MITIKELAGMAKERLQRDKDLVIAVTGDEGDGKSTIALGIGLQVDPLFDFDRNVLYSPTVEETKSKIIGLPKYSVIIADEAIKIMYKLNWGTKIQKFLNIIYALCRQENKLSILCMPRFKDFNEYFRNHRIRFWIHVIDPIDNRKKKGHAILFGKSWNPTSHDSWWLDDLQRTIDRHSHKKRLHEVDYTLKDKIGVLKRSRNFIAVLEFEWINDELWERYLQSKSVQKYGSVEAEETKSINKREERLREWNKVLVKTLLDKGETQEGISKLLGVTHGTISKMVRRVKLME